MRYHHPFKGHGRRFNHDSPPPEHSHPHHGAHRGHHRGGGRSRRLFDYGEIRLLVLAMIAGRPRHGYEIIKEITDRFDGRYSPSPGVIYPTLSWLEDMGYITIEAGEGGRKLSRLTSEGAAFLEANRKATDELLARKPPERISDDVGAAMDRLKSALRAQIGRAEAAPEEAARIAAILTEAADRIAAGITQEVGND